MRQWITLFETADVQRFLNDVAEMMAQRDVGDSYWITDDGTPQACGMYTHSNYAFEYVVEYQTGAYRTAASTANNIVTLDPRKAFALINAP